MKKTSYGSVMRTHLFAHIPLIIRSFFKRELVSAMNSKNLSNFGRKRVSCFEPFKQDLPRNPSILEEWTGGINLAWKYDCAYLSNPRAWGQASMGCLLALYPNTYLQHFTLL